MIEVQGQLRPDTSLYALITVIRKTYIRLSVVKLIELCFLFRAMNYGYYEQWVTIESKTFLA